MIQNGETLLWLGTATYATLAVLAYVFCQERTVFINIASPLFYILKDGALTGTVLVAVR